MFPLNPIVSTSHIFCLNKLIFHYKMIFYSNEFSFTNRANLHTLLKGKTMVPDNVMDKIVMIVIKSIQNKQYLYKRHMAITRQLALLMLNQNHTREVALMIMEDSIHCY